MIWLYVCFAMMLGIGSVLEIKKIRGLKRDLKNLEQWDIHNFRKMECGYVKGDDIGAKPEKYESFFIHEAHMCSAVRDILEDRESMLRATGETLVSINIFSSYVPREDARGIFEVRFEYIDSSSQWSALKEFLKQILRDLHYREDVTGNWSEVWVYPDLRILLGFENDQMISDWMRCVRLSEYSGRFISVDDLNKLKRIRKVMDLHKIWFPVGKTVFNFLMNKRVGLGDERVIDLIATDEGLAKVCNYLRVVNNAKVDSNK